MPRMAYRIETDTARMDVDAIWRMLRRSYWAERVRRSIVCRAVENSICVGAFDESDGRQVGVARAVTDRATFAWLSDVFVDEEHRGHGLAKRMCQALLAHPDIRTVRRWVLATRDAHELYRGLGFQPVVPEWWMELKPDPSVWQESEEA
ncbi:MAG: hypothetical protein CHACPFDD_01777 [Phycisphaerae bacterium]|nr:hypothetical protein [Phycisphaerae bacterium]